MFKLLIHAGLSLNIWIFLFLTAKYNSKTTVNSCMTCIASSFNYVSGIDNSLDKKHITLKITKDPVNIRIS